MHRRHQHLNIPIEIVRTVVAISETGSLSKAGERLGLSQPAVSSQIKRIQNLVGGSLFRKTANGSVVTELGKLVLTQGRRMLEANDQMLLLGGTATGPQPIRLGISTLFISEFLQNQAAEQLADITVLTDHSNAIAKGLLGGYVDIACMFENSSIDPEIEDLVVNAYDETFVWVRSKTFILRPGAPIPILMRPGDDFMVKVLTRHGLQYRVVFNSSDFSAKMAAVEAGLGLAVIPERLVPPNLVRAREYYLPKLPPVKALLCARSGIEGSEATRILQRLESLFFKRQLLAVS